MERYILKHKLGLDPNRDVKVLALGEPVNILPALERNVIQAGLLTTPTILAARKLGFHELIDVDSLGINPDEIIDSSFVRELEDSGFINQLYK